MKKPTMRIDGTEFGNITIDGQKYDHDVVIRLTGEVVKRKKKLSKKLYGTSHLVSKDEAKFVFEKGAELLVVGSEQEAMCGSHPKPGPIWLRKDARSRSSLPRRHFASSTRHVERRSVCSM